LTLPAHCARIVKLSGTPLHAASDESLGGVS
jgi:hypothetical protein